MPIFARLHQIAIVAVAEVADFQEEAGGNEVVANDRRHPFASVAHDVVAHGIEWMHVQMARFEGVDDRFREIARQSLRRQRLLLGMPDDRMLAHFGAREIDALRLAIGACHVTFGRNVRHCAAQRRMQRIGVNRNEDHFFFRGAALHRAREDRVGEIPAEIHADD